MSRINYYFDYIIFDMLFVNFLIVLWLFLRVSLGVIDKILRYVNMFSWVFKILIIFILFIYFSFKVNLIDVSSFNILYYLVMLCLINLCSGGSMILQTRFYFIYIFSRIMSEPNNISHVYGYISYYFSHTSVKISVVTLTR